MMITAYHYFTERCIPVQGSGQTKKYECFRLLWHREHHFVNERRYDSNEREYPAVRLEIETRQWTQESKQRVDMASSNPSRPKALCYLLNDNQKQQICYRLTKQTVGNSSCRPGRGIWSGPEILFDRRHAPVLSHLELLPLWSRRT
jgi:hypothetical protein